MIDIQEIDWKARKDPETRNSLFALRPMREQLLEELKEQMPEYGARLEAVANGNISAAGHVIRQCQIKPDGKLVWMQVFVTLCKRIAAIERERCGLPVPAELQVLA